MIDIMTMEIRFAKSWIDSEKNLNKKESIIKSVAMYKDRINQVNEKLKEQNLSDRQ
jgi:hypothetical protein